VSQDTHELGAADIERIREMLLFGARPEDLAATFGVSSARITSLGA
jgi:hypothetical protein